MSLWQKLISLLMFTILGSTILIANPTVHKAMDSFVNSPNEEIDDALGLDLDRYEVIFWVTILAALGTAVFVLIFIFANFSSTSPEEYLRQLLADSSSFGLY